MSPTATEMPGTLTERLVANAAAGASCPVRRFSITAAGDCTHIRVPGATGQIASTPASGSRTMPLANDDAARLGSPGRTVTVGRRRLRPSSAPRRDRSATSSSPITFCVPYDECGVSGASSGTGSGSRPPNTAIELAKTNLGGAGSTRQQSSSRRVASRLTDMPRS